MCRWDGIQHRENIIDASVIRARHALTLPKVPVFVTTLCRVRQGEKLLQWDDREMRAGPQHLILMPAGREPGADVYRWVPDQAVWR